jgi:hypothetical protein
MTTLPYAPKCGRSVADQHYVRGGFGEELAPFQQALMSIKRVVSPTLNREYGSGKFVRQVQRTNMVR